MVRHDKGIVWLSRVLDRYLKTGSLLQRDKLFLAVCDELNLQRRAALRY